MIIVDRRPWMVDPWVVHRSMHICQGVGPPQRSGVPSTFSCPSHMCTSTPTSLMSSLGLPRRKRAFR
eukprot:scaffold47613_cov66-Phaeocystis_antarctica.AAC.1